MQLAVWLCAAVVAIASTVFLLRQHLRDRRERRRMLELEALGLHIPPTLHPVIDPELCISSAACVTACPEGDVIGLVGGAGLLLHGAACIGHGKCATECPVDAIQLVFGTAQRGIDIPHVSPDFETNRPGLYIAGELGGMGLIRNAIRQGVGAARHAIASITEQEKIIDDAAGELLDLLVIGAGPAGIGAGLACVEARVRYRIIDQQSIGGAVAHYPRQKVVTTEPIEVPLFGRIHRATMLKEELLQLWHEVIDETGVVIETGIKLLDIQGDDGAFEVHTSSGTARARKVLLCIGRQGTPRKLEVEGEEAPQVTYNLTDAEQYRGCQMLVVGGGDSALEAAAALCEEAKSVTLCHRGASFYRAKAPNRAAVERLAAEGRLEIRYETEVDSLTPAQAHLRDPEAKIETIAADHVIAALGGEAPTQLLEKLGIGIERWFGENPLGLGAETHLALGNRRVTGWGWLGYGLAMATLGALSALTWYGADYYQLSSSEREASPLHALLRPSGLVGHGIGVLATVVMLTNFFYAARKRHRSLQRLGGMRAWLAVHVWIGLLAPAVIAFHAAFRSNNLVASVSYWSVAAVVFTGIIGRYVYGRVQHCPAFGDELRLPLKRFLRLWRMGHVVLAILMVLLIVAHIGISFLFGYRWIF